MADSRTRIAGTLLLALAIGLVALVPFAADQALGITATPSRTLTPTFTPTRLPCTALGCPTATPTISGTPCLEDGCDASPTPAVALGAQFSIVIDTDADGDYECSSASTDDGYCVMSVGTAFDMGVILESLPDDIAAYDGFDIVLRTGLFTLKVPLSAAPWPDCVFEAYAANEHRVAVGCAIGVQEGESGTLPPSTYVGLLAKATFTCDSSGDISLVHGLGQTGLIDDALGLHAEADPGADTIRVDCLALGMP